MKQEAAALPRGKSGPVRGLVLKRLERIADGSMTIGDADGWTTIGTGAPHVTLHVRDLRFYRKLAFGGHIGAAEAFMDGWWTCDDLVSLVRILVRNRSVLDSLEGGWARFVQPLRALGHALRSNTRRGSRRNIAEHYDLGNRFFEQFLDPTMSYSCAYFESEDISLEQASRAKNERVCQKLRLGPGDHLLEIGTGWGGLALHAASRFGCRVTTTTISKEQHDVAVARIANAGLADRVTVLLKDYRELEGSFDKLVSIEMVEAVGHKYYGTFFETCGRLLKPDGMMLLQAITLLDKYYDACRREVDFIKRFIFPGSCIPSVSVLCAAASKRTDMRLTHLQDLTPHYAETLRRWRLNFLRNRDAIQELGYPAEFLRMWEFYLCYCEGGYRERFLGNVQMLFAKPDCMEAPLR